MNNQFLKLNKACTENWDNMKPNQVGNFCEQCAKSVIDFTLLNQQEISAKLKQGDGKICARITQKQLDLPLLDFEIQKGYHLPYANITAGLMVATALVTVQPVHSHSAAQTEIVQTSSMIVRLKNTNTNLASKPNHAKPNNFTILNGQVNDEDGMPVNHAKVTLVTVKKLIDVYTAADGTFTLKIPNGLIDNDNVIRVSYDKVKKDTDASRRHFNYDTTDHILSKNELHSVYKIKAKPELFYLGGISSYSKIERHPVVIRNGVKIKYTDYVKAQRRNTTQRSIENKDFYYFSSEAAIAIYGKKAEYGLYILIDTVQK